MKKIRLLQKTSIVVAACIIGLILADSAYAQPLVECGTRSAGPSPDCTLHSLFTLIKRIINLLLGMASLVAIVFVFLGGARMVLAAANPEEVKTAKSTLINAISGFVLVTLAYLIFNVVIQLLMGQDADIDTLLIFWNWN